MKTTHLFAAAAALTALAAPAIAQNAYPQPYPQAYPQSAPGYGQPGFGLPTYGQPGYAYPGPGANAVEQIIGQLLGNRYNVSDRTAVSQCATAAIAQASAQYRGYGQGYPGRGYQGQAWSGQGYNQAYNQARVTAITDVRRTGHSLRVKGQIATGMNHGGAYADPRYNADPRYAQAADLSFRCNVDYRGAVTNLRLSRNSGATSNYRRY